MAEAIKGLFSSAPGLERVNPIGLIVILAAAAVAIGANRLSGLFPGEKQEKMFFAFKLASILICVAGFVIAVI